MLTVNQLCGFGAGSSAESGPPAVTYEGSNQSAANASSYTLSVASSITGPRLVVAAVVCNQSIAALPTSVTYDGGAMTRLASRLGSGAMAAFYGIELTTASTNPSDVVLNLTNLPSRAGVGVFVIKNYTSATPVDSVSSVSNGGSLNLSVTAGDVVLGVSTTSNGTGGYTWTGLTEQYDAATEGASQHTGAMIVAATTGTLAISATRGGSPTEICSLSANWR